MRRREAIEKELEETRTRLGLYLNQEANLLSKRGVQSYSIGTRNIQRYNLDLKAIQDMIAKLHQRVTELEAELDGRSSRHAVGVVPRDW
jgi:hypothetical protein